MYQYFNFSSNSVSKLATDFHVSITFYEVNFDNEAKCLECLYADNACSHNLWCRAEYTGLSDQEYWAWFEIIKKKKKLLPIYKSYADGPVNFVKDVVNFTRQNGLDIYVKIDLKFVKCTI